MSKNKIIIVLLIMLSIGIISLYTTYAYEENNAIIEPIPESDKNLIYSLKESSNKEISVNPNETKFLDISLTNIYDSTIRYGMYYYMLSPTILPDNINISLAEGSQDELENIIKPGNMRSISIKIENKSEYSISLIIGALIGYENGKIEDLVTDGETLIK